MYGIVLKDHKEMYSRVLFDNLIIDSLTITRKFLENIDFKIYFLNYVPLMAFPVR